MRNPRSGRRESTLRPAILLVSFFVVVILAASQALAQPAPLVVGGDTPTNGIFDPSVEYAPGASEGWLAYSAVFGSITPWGPQVETHLARTTDGGVSWQFEGVGFPSTFGVLEQPDGSTIDGVWNAETASLVHDPGDPEAPWKLFAMRIFRRTEDNFTGEQNVPGQSWIAMRTAADPSGPWSTERALFSSGPLPIGPYDVVEVAVNDFDESLASLLVYSEPGAFEKDGTLYVSLTGLTVTGPDRVVLLASDDHAVTWRYAGTLLDSADVQAMGFLSLDGTAIAEDAGRVFLLATPESTTSLHDGTIAIEFESLAAGALERSSGVPVVTRHIPAQAGLPLERRGGQADYHVGNTAGGLLQPALQAGLLPELFHISSTGEGILQPSPVPGPAAGLGGLGLALGLLAAGIGGLSDARCSKGG